MLKNTLRTKLEVHDAEPLYKQVERQILQCLAAGEWKPGEQLPTESQLAERFGVAVFTIRAGISELVASRILLRKQGKGTFVARHGRQRRRYQFSHIYDINGEQILAERKLLSFHKETATGEALQALQLPPAGSTPIFRIACLLTTGDAPVATLDIAVPVAKFPGLTAKAIREETENLYAVYQDVCGINVIRIEEQVFATVAKPAVARSLKIQSGKPVLRINRVAYTYNDTPVEYRVRHFSGDTYCYRFTEGGV
jgi:GntR family transcriptional regulator